MTLDTSLVLASCLRPTGSRHSRKSFVINPSLRWCHAHMETRLSPIDDDYHT